MDSSKIASAQFVNRFQEDGTQKGLPPQGSAPLIDFDTTLRQFARLIALFWPRP